MKNDGLGMELTLTVWDPAYLSEPHTEVWKFKKVPDGEVAFAGFDCDLQSARRHLLVERVIDNDTVSSSAHTQNSENSPRRYPFHLIFGVCVFAAGVAWFLRRRR